MRFSPESGADVLAILVGVEDVGVGDPLIGPALDAARLAAWLGKRNVPRENIKLFLSPWGDQAHVARIEDELRECGLSLADSTAATENNIWSWVANELAQHRRCDHLVFFWSGHGVIDQIRRRLICADVTQDILQNFNFTDFARRLQELRYSQFTRQVLIVDTCANLYADMRDDASMPDHALPASKAVDTTSQLAVMAASYGQFAKNLERTGAFFAELLDALARCAPSEWPDFDPLFAEIGRAVDARSAGAQTPTQWKFEADGQPRLASATRLADASPRAEPLLDALRKLPDVPKIRRLFYLTSRGAPGEPIEPTLERMVRYLDRQADQHDGTIPLLEFGFRAAHEYPKEELLAAWRDAQRDQYAGAFTAFERRLQEEHRTFDQVTKTLVVRVLSSRATAVEYQVVAHDEDGSLPTPNAFTSHPLEGALDVEAFAAALRSIVMKVDNGEGVLAIQLQLPHDLLVWDVEAQPASDVGGPADCLGRSYPMTLCWVERARDALAPQQKRAWRHWAELFEGRLRNGVSVAWADVGGPLCVKQVDDTLRRMRAGGGSVLGLGLGIAASVQRTDPVPYCLASGVPFAVWSHGDPVSAAVRNTVEIFFARRQDKDLLRRLVDLRDPTAMNLGPAPPSVKVLWDAPPAKPTRLDQPAVEEP